MTGDNQQLKNSLPLVAHRSPCLILQLLLQVSAGALSVHSAQQLLQAIHQYSVRVAVVAITIQQHFSAQQGQHLLP